MMLDRFGDIERTARFSVYYYYSFPHWDVCLGIYIVLHLVSFALYSNIKMCKFYAFRTVLATIISGFTCSAVAWLPCIIAWNNDPLVLLPVCEYLARSIWYAVVLVQAYRKTMDCGFRSFYLNQRKIAGCIDTMVTEGFSSYMTGCWIFMSLVYSFSITSNQSPIGLFVSLFASSLV